MLKDHFWILLSRKLGGEATPEEIQELEDLLRSDPDLHYSMQTILDWWTPGKSSPQPENLEAFHRHVERMQAKGIPFSEENDRDDLALIPPYPDAHGRSRSWRIIATGSAIALTISILYFFAQRSSSGPILQPIISAVPVTSEVSTQNGSKTKVVLPDSSLVWLNAGSKLVYDKEYGNAIREVTLSGEAFFDVVKNAEKPFLIHTSRMDIKVLGTRFDVKAYPADKTTEATLIRGSIEVSLKNKHDGKIILKPNEKIIVGDDKPVMNPASPGSHTTKDNPAESIIAIRQPVFDSLNNTIVETSWLENKLIFHDESFGDLAKLMERWYGVNIHFSNLAKMDLHFTGTFKKETIQQALDVLHISNPAFNYRFALEEIEIY